jgi:hypothetical protein
MILAGSVLEPAMDKAFYVIWPVYMLVELIVDIDVTLEESEGSGATLMNLLTGESKVKLCVRLRITHYKKDSTSVYQFLFSHDDKETTLEVGELEPNLHGDDCNKPGQIIPTPTVSLQEEFAGCDHIEGVLRNRKNKQAFLDNW